MCLREVQTTVKVRMEGEVIVKVHTEEAVMEAVEVLQVAVKRKVHLSHKY
jgi:hypothetical protein